MKRKHICLGLIILSSIFFTSCEYHMGGAKVFEATSDSEQGKSEVERYHIKYISPDAYGVCFSDVYRKDGYFAYDVIEKDDDISYKRIDDAYVKENQLKPRFNWWQSYGALIGVPMFILLIVGMIKMGFMPEFG